LILRRLRPRPGVLEHLAEVADVAPAQQLGQRSFCHAAITEAALTGRPSEA